MFRTFQDLMATHTDITDIINTFIVMYPIAAREQYWYIIGKNAGPMNIRAQLITYTVGMISLYLNRPVKSVISIQIKYRPKCITSIYGDYPRIHTALTELNKMLYDTIVENQPSKFFGIFVFKQVSLHIH